MFNHVKYLNLLDMIKINGMTNVKLIDEHNDEFIVGLGFTQLFCVTY